MKKVVNKRPNREAIARYCEALGWDVPRYYQGLRSTGLSHESLYLESPNKTNLQVLSEFLTITESSLMIVVGANGYGKSALKECVVREVADDTEFSIVCMNAPGPLTQYQVALAIYTSICPDASVPRSTVDLVAALEHALIERRHAGCTTVVWVDEGQKLKLDQIGMLRTISDFRTPPGELVAKIIISGTLDLQSHIERWIESDPEEAGAFDSRCGLHTLTLKPWTESHVREWITQFCRFVASSKKAKTPFDPQSLALIHAMSDGNPRVVIQLVHLVLNYKAGRYAANSTTDTAVSAPDIQATMDLRE